MELKMINLYRSIMDSKMNPLRDLPAAQRLQIMLFLSVMWTTIFCAVSGLWVWYGALVIAHILLAIGFLVTGLTFNNARRIVTYRDCPRKDGTARYDDVWGA
jgi:hypothetical protein